MEDSVLYIMIGILKDRMILIDYPDPVNPAYKESAKKIFLKLDQKSSNINNEKFKVDSALGVFHFIIYDSDTFYLVLSDKYYPQQSVFELISQLHKEKLYEKINENSITPEGRNSFCSILEKNRGEKEYLSKLELVHKSDKLTEDAKSRPEDVKDGQEEFSAKGGSVSVESSNVVNIIIDIGVNEHGNNTQKNTKVDLTFGEKVHKYKWTIIILSAIFLTIIVVIPIAVLLSPKG